MITVESDAEHLWKYYDDLCEAQAREHGEGFLDVHREIRKLIALEGHRNYTELGIAQGTTLACALLSEANTVIGYDKNLERLSRPELFRDCAKLVGANLQMLSGDSLQIKIAPTDILYIDTRHVPRQLEQELDLHGHKAKIIICHDTESKPLLQPVIEAYAEKTNRRIITKNVNNVGFITLGEPNAKPVSNETDLSSFTR